MKTFFRSLLPKSLVLFYHKIVKCFRLKQLYSYNCKRFVNFGARKDSEDALIGYLTMAIHGIEKGMTMPDFRVGFGHDRMCSLLKESEYFIQHYGIQNPQIWHLAQVVYEYDLLHKNLQYQLDKNLQSQIDVFLTHFNVDFKETIQVDTTRDQYFSKINSDFLSFSYSRHSIRNFTPEPVLIDQINKAISLSQNAPSACNRQSARVYVIQDKEKIKQVFSLHGGNRGFGHTVDKLLVICGYLPCYGVKERDCVYVDCGIFTMNLAYSLHFYGIGNCILNWSATNEHDKALRDIIPIKDDETICTLVACGNVPENFKFCNSGKKSLSQIVRYI